MVGKSQSAADLRPDDFAKVRAEIPKHAKAVRTKNEIVRIQGVFRWADYRRRVSDERLRAVAETVRCWLSPPKAEGDDQGEHDRDAEPATIRFPATG